jgi:CMP-N-acetylneuraminic acid synthetase
MKKKIVAFVPIRLNSKRIIGKNIKMLGNKPLLTYIFEKLIEVEIIDDIYAYCSSEEIIPHLPSKVKFLKRSVDLDQDNTLGQEIYSAFVNDVDADIYILAHTTSPFVKNESISNALNKLINEDFDSAFSVEKVQTFIWYKNLPLNYSLTMVPRTQDLEPIYVETSAFFIFKKEIWTEFGRRIGFKPYLQIVDKIEAVDIDNPEDFKLAEKIVKNF